MKEKKRQRFRCVQAHSAEEYEILIQAILDENSGAKITHHATTPLLAYVEWTDYEKIPETLADEYELAGEQHCCGECPHIEREGGTWNQKKFPCKYAKYGATYTTMPACDVFYSALARGEIRKEAQK